jgi:hypothetical protein
MLVIARATVSGLDSAIDTGRIPVCANHYVAERS